MKMMIRLLVSILLVMCAAAPARAQFADQATYAATSAGAANAITVSIANVGALADIKGVPIRVLMTTSNTSTATIAVSGLAATAIQKLTTAGLSALAGGEVVAGQVSTFMYDGTVFELLSPNLFLGTVPVQSGFDTAVNLQLTCTAAANALTCAMKAANTGLDPSSVAPVYIPFRDTTITAGGPVWRTITAATSFTVSGGNTMGCSSGAPCRLWITAIDNAGTVLLGLSNQVSTTTCFALNEASLQTTGSGTGGGSTSGTIFTSVSAVSTKAVRIIGYVEWTTLVTAGNWTSPNVVQLFGPGIKKPCDVVQSAYASSSTYANTGNTYSPSVTAPLPAGGASVTSLAFSTQSAANRLRIRAGGVIGNSGSGASNVFLYVHNGTGTLAVGSGYGGAASVTQQVSFVYEVMGTAPGSVTYTLYYTGSVANTFINGSAGTQFGGANTSIEIEEIMGELEPANDNAALRMVG